MKPQPNRQARLVCWQLVHKVPVPDEPTEADERQACERVKLPWEAWQQAKTDFPRLLVRVASQRQRRRLWQLHFGPVPNGWTPPEPGRPQTRNHPAAALAYWRQQATALGVHGEELDRWLLLEQATDAELQAPEAIQAAYARASNEQKPGADVLTQGDAPGLNPAPSVVAAHPEPMPAPEPDPWGW